MFELAAINAEIQRRLMLSGLQSVTAVEAARWLDDAGLLKDSAHRPGLPLRELLRSGLIDGQHQEPPTPHGRWFIESLERTPEKRRIDDRAAPSQPSSTTSWYEELRQKYRPDRVRILLIGESPPDPGAGDKRFFYSPVLSYDNLYRGVALALFEGEPWFRMEDKATVLDRLKADGFWLIDAVDRPINKLSNAGRRAAIRAGIPRLVEHCQETNPSDGVIVCHGLVFAESAASLHDNGVRLLHDSPIPFPLGNWRSTFVTLFRGALARVNRRPRPPSA